MCSASSIARYQKPISGSLLLIYLFTERVLLFSTPDLSLDMWYRLRNNASMFKMSGYNLHPAKKQECLLNQAFEGRL